MIVFNEIAPQLAEAAVKGYRGGLAAMVKLNKKKILQLHDTKNAKLQNFSEPLFKISYTGTDERLLKNFEVEAFTVAGVMNYECEEKLKSAAKKILDGSHPLLQKNPEADIKALWRDEAYNILADYIDVPEMPPPSFLQTNLRTATVSAYYAAQWQRLQGLKDVYTAYRYKTMNDNRVRESHAALHNKVFNANDPIWDSIFPPNSWNCRCTVEPLSDDELTEIPSDDKVRLEDKEQRAALLSAADVKKDFNRNSGKAESIWGKWLERKFGDKDYEEITDRMKQFVSAMPDAKIVEDNLVKFAAPYRDLQYSKESVEKEFPDYKVETPLGEFNFSKKFWDKLETEERKNLFGLVKPTMQRPEYIIVDEHYGTLFLRAFEKDGVKIFTGVITSQYGHIVSFHQKGNLASKIKNGKLLIYESERVHSTSLRGAGSPDSFVELPDATGHQKLEKFDSNVRSDSDTVNEMWGEFISVGKTHVRKIRYKVEGFEAALDDGEFALKEYSRIDDYRKGVLMRG